MSKQKVSSRTIDSKNGIIGLAVGDAIGVPLEFLNREDLINNPVTTMLEDKKERIPKGSWSDDTSLNIALIDSINKNQKVDLYDIGQRFIAWGENGEYTPTGKMFGIGRTTLKAIARLEEGKLAPEECGGDTESENGNGSLMRILPLVYYCYSKNLNEKEIYEVVKNVSSITHRHEISIMGCFIYVMYGISLLNDKNLLQSYKYIKKLKYNTYFSKETIDKYKRILGENIAKCELEEIKSTGFVIDTLEATIWTLLNTDSYNQAIIGAINLGGDADTVGACVGGVAGIYYGLESINKDWIKDLQKYDYIENMCNEFNKVLNEEI